MLDLLKEGKTCAAISRQYGTNESTIRTIRDNEDKIRKAVTVSFCSSEDGICPGVLDNRLPQEKYSSRHERYL